MIKKLLSTKQKKNVFVRMILCNVLIILLVMGTSCSKEKEEQVYPTVNPNSAQGHGGSTQYEVSVEIHKWRTEGFVGTAVTGNDMIKKGENVTVIFDDSIKVVKSDGSEFKYDIENPNAEECGIKNETIVNITYSSYELAKENDIYTTIYANKITE